MGDLTRGKRKVPESLGNAWLRDSSDEELLERLRAGDEAGVEEVVSRYAGPAYRVALRLITKTGPASVKTLRLNWSFEQWSSGPSGPFLLMIAQP